MSKARPCTPSCSSPKAQAHPGLVIAQHLPVAERLEKDPFTIDVGKRYAQAGYVCAIPFLFH